MGRGLACPAEALSQGALDALVDARAARLASLFLKCARRPLAERSAGLAAVLEDLRDRPGGLEGAWSSALGRLRLAMLARPLDPHEALCAAAGVALHRAERGRPLTFEVTLERTAPFRFGRYELGLASRIALSSDGASVELSLTDDATSRPRLVTLRREGESGAWLSRSIPGAPVVRFGDRSVPLYSSLPHGEPLPERLVPSSPAEAARAGELFEAAFGLVARRAPTYRAWVERAVRALIPVTSAPGTTASSSFELVPGVVALSHASPTLAVADALVHEASHQHFFLLSQCGPVDDGSDDGLYWSPAPRAYRPIGKILLAYHAFANIQLFLRECIDNGIGDSAGEERAACCALLAAYEAPVAELARPLDTTGALTPLGRALYEPLAARVAASEPNHLVRQRILGGHALCNQQQE